MSVYSSNQGQPSQPVAGLRFIRVILEGNYLYVFSALLVILGCYLLMNSTVPSGGELLKVLKTLGILQAYEVAVLATSVLIVRKLLRLDDAFTLLLVEIGLLLDPTFFSNNFFTLMQSDRATSSGVLVNIACLALVAFKLLILQQFLQFRLSWRGFASFLLIAALVYIGPYYLALKDTEMSRHTYFYLMTWSIPLALFLLPATDKVLAWTSDRRGFLSTCQKYWLPRLFVVIPIPILLLHIGETWWVHNLAFYGAYLSPLLVALAIRVSHPGTRTFTTISRVFVVDMLMLFGILMSFPRVYTDWKEVYNLPPAYLGSMMTVAITGLAACGVYALFYFRTRYLPALYRIGVLSLAGVIGFAAKIGFWTMLHEYIATGARETALYALDHRFYVALAAWACMLFWLIRKPGPIIAFFSGTMTLILGANLLPDPRAYILEFLQLFFLMVLVLYHIWGSEKHRKDRYAAASMIALFALIRLFMEPRLWTACMILGEGGLFFYAAWRLRHWGYSLVGMIQLGALSVLILKGMPGVISPANFLVILGFIIFAAGILVTFRKEDLMRYVARLEAGPHQPETHRRPFYRDTKDDRKG